MAVARNVKSSAPEEGQELVDDDDHPAGEAVVPTAFQAVEQIPVLIAEGQSGCALHIGGGRDRGDEENGDEQERFDLTHEFSPFHNGATTGSGLIERRKDGSRVSLFLCFFNISTIQVLLSVRSEPLVPRALSHCPVM
jgi:hypothetical protein